MQFQAATEFAAQLLPIEFSQAIRQGEADANPLDLDPAIHGHTYADGESETEDRDSRCVHKAARIALNLK